MLRFSGSPPLKRCSLISATGTCSRVTLWKPRPTLLAPLSGGELNPERQRNGSAQRWDRRLLAQCRPARRWWSFWKADRTSPAAQKVNSKLLAEFIRKMSALGELTTWSIASWEQGGKPAELVPGLSIGMITRKSETTSQPEYYSIGRLLSPRDESIDLDNAAWNAALQFTLRARQDEPPRNAGKPDEPDAPNGPAIRRVWGIWISGVAARPERGLLIIYAIDPDQGGDGALPPERLPSLGLRSAFQAAIPAQRLSIRSTTSLGSWTMAAANSEQDILRAWRALSESVPEHDAGWKTIALQPANLNVRAGIRFPEREEAVLAGFSNVGPVTELPKGRGFRVTEIALDTPDNPRRWYGLSRQAGADPAMFLLMVLDVLSVLHTVDRDSEKLRKFMNRIYAWQVFMEKRHDRVLGEEAEIGLHGELLVLEFLLRKGVNLSGR